MALESCADVCIVHFNERIVLDPVNDHIAVIYSRLPLEHIEQFIVILVRSTLLKNKD